MDHWEYLHLIFNIFWTTKGGAVPLVPERARASSECSAVNGFVLSARLNLSFGRIASDKRRHRPACVYQTNPVATRCKNPTAGAVSAPARHFPALLNTLPYSIDVSSGTGSGSSIIIIIIIAISQPDLVQAASGFVRQRQMLTRTLCMCGRCFYFPVSRRERQ